MYSCQRNVVRHVAGHDQVGALKVRAVHHVIERHAPWTEVIEFPESSDDSFQNS